MTPSLIKEPSSASHDHVTPGVHAYHLAAFNEPVQHRAPAAVQASHPHHARDVSPELNLGQLFPEETSSAPAKSKKALKKAQKLQGDASEHHHVEPFIAPVQLPHTPKQLHHASTGAQHHVIGPSAHSRHAAVQASHSHARDVSYQADDESEDPQDHHHHQHHIVGHSSSTHGAQHQVDHHDPFLPARQLHAATKHSATAAPAHASAFPSTKMSKKQQPTKHQHQKEHPDRQQDHTPEMNLGLLFKEPEISSASTNVQAPQRAAVQPHQHLQQQEQHQEPPSISHGQQGLHSYVRGPIEYLPDNYQERAHQYKPVQLPVDNTRHHAAPHHVPPVHHAAPTHHAPIHRSAMPPVHHVAPAHHSPPDHQSPAENITPVHRQAAGPVVSTSGFHPDPMHLAHAAPIYHAPSSTTAAVPVQHAPTGASHHSPTHIETIHEPYHPAPSAPSHSTPASSAAPKKKTNWYGAEVPDKEKMASAAKPLALGFGYKELKKAAMNKPAPATVAKPLTLGFGYKELKKAAMNKPDPALQSATVAKPLALGFGFKELKKAAMNKPAPVLQSATAPRPDSAPAPTHQIPATAHKSALALGKSYDEPVHRTGAVPVLPDIDGAGLNAASYPSFSHHAPEPVCLPTHPGSYDAPAEVHLVPEAHIHPTQHVEGPFHIGSAVSHHHAPDHANPPQHAPVHAHAPQHARKLSKRERKAAKKQDTSRRQSVIESISSALVGRRKNSVSSPVMRLNELFDGPPSDHSTEDHHGTSTAAASAAAVAAGLGGIRTLLGSIHMPTIISRQPLETHALLTEEAHKLGATSAHSNATAANHATRHVPSKAVALKSPKLNLALFPEEQANYPRGDTSKHQNPARPKSIVDVCEIHYQSHPESQHQSHLGAIGATAVPFAAASRGVYGLHPELNQSSTVPLSQTQKHHSTAAALKTPKVPLGLFPEEEEDYPRGADRHRENHPAGPKERPASVKEIQLDAAHMHPHHDLHPTMTETASAAVEYGLEELSYGIEGIKSLLGGIHLPDMPAIPSIAAPVATAVVAATAAKRAAAPASHAPPVHHAAPSAVPAKPEHHGKDDEVGKR